MKKFLQTLALAVAIMLPWAMNAQSLSDYQVTVDQSSTTFTSIASTGTEMSFTSTDDGYAACTVPFAFPFGESFYNAGFPVAASGNGFLYLNTISCSGTTASSTGTYNVINAFLGQDGHMGRYSGVSNAYYEATVDDNGDSCFIIEFKGLGRYSSPYGFFTYQVVLYPTGNIDIVFDSLQPGSTSDDIYKTFLRDGANNDNLFLSGSWTTPSTGTSDITMPTTGLPTRGTRIRFTRPVVTCPKPANFTFTNLTPESADVSWLERGTATSWVFEYADSVIVPGTGNGTVINATDTVVSLTGLTPNTRYYVYVHADCGGDTSLNLASSFRTACVALTADDLPWIYGFEDATASGPDGQIDQCLYRGTNSTTAYPYPSSSYSHSGSYSLYYYAYSTIHDYLCLPLTEDSIYDLQVRFWARRTSTDYTGKVIVGVMTNPADYSTFVGVDTVFANNGTDWSEFEVNLNGYHGPHGYITLGVLEPLPSEYSYNNVYIDDITLAHIPSCLRPDNFVQTGITGSSVSLAWQDTIGDAWEVIYGPYGFDPYADNSDNENIILLDNIYEDSVEVTDLYDTLTYDFYVRTVCSDGNSDWRGPVSAMPGSINLPVSGAYSIAACGINIFDDGGANGNYSNNCDVIYTIYPSSPDSLVTISGTFLGSEGSIDYLRIYDGASTMQSALLYQYNGSSTQVIGPFTSNSGPITLKFHSDGSIVYGGFQIRADCVAAPECTPVINVEMSHVAATSAFASWELMNENVGEVQSFNLEIVDLDNNSTSTLTSNTQYALLTGLTPFTNYCLRVQTECTDGNSTWDSVSFHTGCLAGGNVVMGTDVSQTSGVPVNSSWGNTACQSIFTVEELQAAGLVAGPINGISYTWTTSNSYDKDFTIFINTTSASTYTASGSSFQTVGNQVYTGAHPIGTTGSVDYYFTTPYVWDGTSNIVVTTFMNQPSGASHSSSGFYGLSTSTSDTRTLYSYKDSNPYTTSGLSSSTNVYTSTYRPSVTFLTACDSNASCAAPNVVLAEIGADDAEVIWAAGNGESSWEVAHKLVSENDWTIDATATSATSYTFTNLLPANDYMFRVSHVCGGETFERIVTGSTVCVPVQVPIYEDFETWVAGSAWGTPAAPCWTKFNEYSTTSSYPYVSTYLGSKSMYFYGPSSGGTDGIILPAIENGIDSLQISFRLAYSSANYGVAVGVMTDPANLATFTQVATAVISQANVWNNFEISLSSYHGSGKYIAIFPIFGSYNYCYLDNIEVTYIPTCPRPTNVVASNMTQTSADIAWVDSATTEFEVEFGPAGFAHGQGTVVSVTGATTTTLTGLQHSTVYDVYVRGICTGNDTSSWSFVSNFVTACGLLDVFPFTETFDNWGTGTTVHAPQCWAYGSDYNSSYPYISTTHNSGVGSMYFYNYSSSTSPNPNSKTWLMMPAIDTTIVTMNQMMVSFNIYDNSSSYQHPLVVGVSSVEGSISSFVPVDTIYPVFGEWNFHEVYFDQYAGTGKYVTFASILAPGETASYPYLDDVTLEMIPSCPRPDHLTASNATSSTIDLGWNDRGTASNWIIEYGPQGFELGTGTTVIANSNPFTLTNLPSSYVGEYYVRALCGVGDTSPYSRQSCLFSTAQVPAAVPYSYDFENAAEFANWQQSTNPSSDVHWVRGTIASSTLGTGSNGMFCTNDDSTAAYVANVTNTTIYRDIDFGTTDTSFIIGFDAYMGGSTVASYDGLMVFLADPSVPVVSTDANITTPWGSVNDLYRIAQVRYTSLDNNGWTRFEGSFDHISGVHRVAFFWFHQGATTNFVGDLAMVDNISIDYASCPRPTEVQATNVASTNATLTWRGPASAEYQVIYRPYPQGTSNTYVTTNSNSITLTGLSAMTQYAVWVRKVCGTDTSRTSDGFLFSTELCDNVVVVENWDSTMITSTTSYFPGYSLYNYSFSETIVDSAFLADAGLAADAEITAFAFKPTTTTAGTYFTNCDVYMANISQSTIGDFIHLDTTWVKVIEAGDLCYSDDSWQLHGFDVPFTWDGHSNVLVAVNRMHGTYVSGATFQGHNNPGKSIYIYQDGSAYNPATVSGGYSSTIAPDYRFYVCGAGCAAPALTGVTDLAYNQATINWASSATDFEVSILNNGVWNAETAVSNAYSYTFTNLTPATTYQYRVRAICDAAEGLSSDWAMGTFTTDSLPCFAPTALAANNIEGTSVDLTWTAGGAETQWMVKVWNTTYADSVIANSTSTSINGLVAATAYQAAVKAICGNGAAESDWSEPISFTTATCAPVSGVQAGNITANSASISWTNNGTATQWEIEYGMAGFGQGEGTTITANANPTTLTGLESELQYDVYVRAICGENWVSEWATKVTFTTTGGNQQGIDNVEGMNVAIYPNPTSGATTISLSGVEGEVSLVIVDMSGRRVMSDKMECSSADCVKTINVENLAQGAYFVRIQGQNTNMVKKLIVK